MFQNNVYAIWSWMFDSLVVITNFSHAYIFYGEDHKSALTMATSQTCEVKLHVSMSLIQNYITIFSQTKMATSVGGSCSSN